MMGVLSLDTVSDVMVVAFERPGAEPVVVEHRESREHTRALLDLITRACGGDQRGISEIVVVRGPGAYGGLRVGVATAQALGLALGIPVHGISTFEASLEAARGHIDGETRSVAVHPAGRGEFSMQRFERGEADGECCVGETAAIPDLPLFGEGAGELGGIEIAPRDRCLGALAAHRRGVTAEAIALYTREPHITKPKDPGWRS